MGQVNTSGEESKGGCRADECANVVNHILVECPHLQFGGLMTIGAPGCLDDFQVLHDCRTAVCDQVSLSLEECELSMGMSGDYAEAVRHGSTNVRVGSTIFGARDYPAKPAPASDTEP